MRMTGMLARQLLLACPAAAAGGSRPLGAVLTSSYPLQATRGTGVQWHRP